MTVHITTSATVISETGELKLARIGWQNRARSASISASSSADGYPALAARNDNTYEFWKPTATDATWRADLGSALACNYMGLHGDFNGATLRAQYSSNDTDWSNASDTAVPTGDTALFLFPSQTARYWRLLVAGQIPTLAHIRFGTVLTMSRPVWRGLTPTPFARETVMRPNVSERGQWLGRSVIRAGLALSIGWQHLTTAWYRANFDAFAQDAQDHPFFLAWRPEPSSASEHDVGYFWSKGDIVPENSGPRDFVSVQVNLQGAASV